MAVILKFVIVTMSKLVTNPSIHLTTTAQHYNYGDTISIFLLTFVLLHEKQGRGEL